MLDVRSGSGETTHKRLAQLFGIPAKRLLLVCRGRSLKTEEEVTAAALAGAAIVLLGTVAEKQARRLTLCMREGASCTSKLNDKKRRSAAISQQSRVAYCLGADRG